jgi:hypothetical protein
MPERPLLILPTPGEPTERRRRFGGGDRIHRPSRARQAERLRPRFEELQRAFERRRARLQIEAAGIVPEEVLVLITAGPVENFIVAVRNVPGMEWLGEIEEEAIPADEDFFALDRRGDPRPDKPLRGRLFLVFTNHEALTQLLSLWGRWQTRQPLPRGLAKWKDLFRQLIDVRPWGVRDRLLETGVLDDWRERIEHNQETVPCEIELWFRINEDQRLAGRDRLVGLVNGQQGRIVGEAVIEEIAYHALLAHLPAASVNTLFEDAGFDAALVQCEQVQFFRASGQMAGIIPDDERGTEEEFAPELERPPGEPIVALLDGLPLQGHRKLLRHLVIDDPDDIESRYQAHERRHGTAMASLIVHGDLDGGDDVLGRQVYVRPILQPDSRDWRGTRDETVPESTLVVDLIHRAVRRIFEGDAGEPPVAPNICVVNLSIGIRDRLFDGSLSPLARLLDWLAWKYQVLFVVSAGNHLHPIELTVLRDDFPGLTQEEIQEQVIRVVAADTRHRRLLSPAEAVNVLTVAAVHDDGSIGAGPVRSVSPLVDRGLPSPINAQGMGYRRAIKPEILAPGGRVVLQERPGLGTNAKFNIYPGTLPPGQKVAAPGRTLGELSALWHTRGTSNATALTTRSASIISDVLDELRDEPGGEVVDTIPRAIWLKALLAHSTDWGSAGDILDRILRTPENTRQFKEYVTRLLGYGCIDMARVCECTAYRVTALSGGHLGIDEAHIHRFPLPPSLSGRRGERKLYITLAWLTPVNPWHQRWRRADLSFSPPLDALRVSRQQAEWRAVQRGTIQHEVLQGDRAAAFVDGDNLDIHIGCRADAGALEEEVPYALVVTLEVAEEIGVPIYEEVRVRVHARIPIAATP